MDHTGFLQIIRFILGVNKKNKLGESVKVTGKNKKRKKKKRAL